MHYSVGKANYMNRQFTEKKTQVKNKSIFDLILLEIK